MRKSREHAATTREHIVETAARLFRERGINGIGLSDLMSGAGLTHGGFYKHFASKDALVAAACESAFARSYAEVMQGAATARDEDALSVVVDSYLTQAHRDHPGQGCVIAALGAEAARGNDLLKIALGEGIGHALDAIGAQVKRITGDNAEQISHAVLSALVGGLVLARAVADPVRSQAILRDTRDFILNAVKKSPGSP